MGRLAFDESGHVSATANDGTTRQLSNRYGWSEHNCSCNRSKTGLVLYPSDIKYKNIVLLVCQNCYGYQPGGGTQHQQLINWYYEIYRDSKQFEWISGFCQNHDGSLGFNSSSCNLAGPYSSGQRTCLALEQGVIERVVRGKLNDYRIVAEENDTMLKRFENHTDERLTSQAQSNGIKYKNENSDVAKKFSTAATNDRFKSGLWTSRCSYNRQWYGPFQSQLSFDPIRKTLHGYGQDYSGQFTWMGSFSELTGQIQMAKTYVLGTGNPQLNRGNTNLVYLTWNNDRQSFIGPWFSTGTWGYYVLLGQSEYSFVKS